MENSTKNIIWITLSLIAFFITIPVVTYGQSQKIQGKGTDKSISAKAPDIVDIIPLAGQSNYRLVDLQNKNDEPDIVKLTIEKIQTTINSALELIMPRLEAILLVQEITEDPLVSNPA